MRLNDVVEAGLKDLDPVTTGVHLKEVRSQLRCEYASLLITVIVGTCGNAGNLLHLKSFGKRLTKVISLTNGNFLLRMKWLTACKNELRLRTKICTFSWWFQSVCLAKVDNSNIEIYESKEKLAVPVWTKWSYSSDLAQMKYQPFLSKRKCKVLGNYTLSYLHGADLTWRTEKNLLWS